MDAALTTQLAPMRPQPFATWNPTRGIWETNQPDLWLQRAPYSATWPTSGYMHDGSAYQRHWSAHHITAFGSSSSRTGQAGFRTPLASDSTRGGETLDQVKARRGTIALSHQIIDFAFHGSRGSPNRNDASGTLWSLIETLFDDGAATPTPLLDGNTSQDDRRRHPHS